MAAQRLARLAAPLRPALEPYYVWLPPAGMEREFPAAGWYWRPAGQDYVVYLAANEIAAAIALQRLIDRELAEEEPDSPEQGSAAGDSAGAAVRARA